MSGKTIRIATRGSRLALWQAKHTAELLRSADPQTAVEIVRVGTTGDRDRKASLRQIGGIGVFTREIQTAVLEGRADVAVHSLKDLPTEPADGLVLAAVPERAAHHDALVLPAGSGRTSGLQSLAESARVGTGSLRRRAQLLFHRPDLQMLDVRGNVETRIEKLDAGQYDALVLAVAGLTRLGLPDRISLALNPPRLYPAVGQGALGIECRSDDHEAAEVLSKISHRPTVAAVTAERTLLAALRAGCHAPVGVATSWENRRLTLEAVVLSPDGRRRLTAAATKQESRPVELGTAVADDLLAQGADALIAAMNDE